MDPLSQAISTAGGALAKGLVRLAKPYVLGTHEARALRGVFERALDMALTEAVGDEVDRDTAAVVESVFGRWASDAEVQAELVAATAEVRRPNEQLLRRRFEELGFDEETLPFETDGLMVDFGEAAGREIETEIGLKDSALSNMVTQGRLKAILEAVSGEKVVSPESTRGTAPRRPDLLFGRDGDIAELLRRLAPEDVVEDENRERSGPRTTAVVGLPGVGKTSVAAELCARGKTQDLFPHGLLWASLGPAPDLVSILAEWSRSVGGPDLHEYPSVEDASRQLAAFLRGKRMLVVADDVFEAEHTVPLKVIDEGALLATSRAPEVARGLAAQRDIYELRPLEDDDSVELLREVAPTLAEEKPGLLRDLARHLDGLPLALHVAGRLLEEESAYGWGVEGLLEELRQGRRLLESKAPADVGGLGGDISPTVEVLLKTSYERLDEEVRQGFRRLGVMEAKPSTFDLEAAEAVWGLVDGKRVLSTLVRRGLVERAGDGRFVVHRVLATFAKYLLEEDQNELNDAGERHTRYFMTVLGSANGMYFGGDERTREGARLLGTNWENIRTGHDWAEIRRGRDEEAARLCIEYFGVGEYWLPLRLTPEEHVVWAQAAVESASLLDDHVAEANNLVRLGNGYERAGHPEDAKTCYEAALKKYRGINDRLGESRALGSLGTCHKALGDPDVAERCYLEQLRITEGLGDVRSEAATRGNLGVLYKDAGRPHDAKREISKAKEMFGRVGDVRDAAGASANLGMVYFGLGEFNRAETELQNHLEVARELGDRESELRAMGNLGFVHSARKEHETAISCHEQSLSMAREIGNARAECSAVGSLAGSHHRAGNVKGAADLYEEQLRTASSTNDLRCRADALHNFGNLVGETGGHPDLALALLKEGYHAYRRIGYPLGEANALWNASLVHANVRNDVDTARSFAEKALVIYERIGSPKAQEVCEALRRWRDDGAP